MKSPFGDFDDGACPAGHAPSATLLSPRCDLCELIECNEPPRRRLPTFGIDNFVNHEERVQVAPLRGVKSKFYERADIETEIFSDSPIGSRRFLLDFNGV